MLLSFESIFNNYEWLSSDERKKEKGKGKRKEEKYKNFKANGSRYYWAGTS
jgi:hypothetical protein